jgi:hypothetical protein
MSSNAADSWAGVAVKTGFGVVLISTGVVIFAGTIFVDLCEMIFGQPFGNADSRFLGMMATGIFGPILIIGVLAMTLYLSFDRCRSWKVALINSAAAIYCMVAPAVLSVFSGDVLGFYFLLPAVMLGKVFGSSVGWYLGSIIQFVVGAWLMGWLHPFRLRPEQKVS